MRSAAKPSIVHTNIRTISHTKSHSTNSRLGMNGLCVYFSSFLHYVHFVFGRTSSFARYRNHVVVLAMEEIASDEVRCYVIPWRLGELEDEDRDNTGEDESRCLRWRDVDGRGTDRRRRRLTRADVDGSTRYEI